MNQGLAKLCSVGKIEVFLIKSFLKECFRYLGLFFIYIMCHWNNDFKFYHRVTNYFALEPPVQILHVHRFSGASKK